jgi:arabinofuranosyltransferase
MPLGLKRTIELPRSAGLALVAVGSVGLAGLLLVNVWRNSVIVEGHRYYALHDDAMISMRYAYNLARGNGLVWSPGEYVQGFTNLGWTLLMAVPLWLGVPVPLAPLVMKIINVALHVAILALVFAWASRRNRSIQGLVGAFLVAIDGSLLTFGFGGFEVMAQALLIMAACLSVFEGTPAAAAPIYAALAVVVRPDAMIVLAWIGAAVCLRLLRGQGCRRDLGALSTSGLIIAAVFIFQRLYYGDWWPNTFYLKAPDGTASLSTGLAYLRRYALAEHVALPLLLAPLALAAWRWMVGGRIPLLLVGLLLSWTAYVVGVGGDAFAHGRFFAPIVPLLALSAGALVEDVARALGRRRVVTGSAAALVMIGLGAHVAPYRQNWVAAPRLLSPDAVNGICLAWALHEAVVPRDAVIGVFFAGTLPYYMPEFRFHDMLGKSDRVIAHGPTRQGPPGHNKWDYAYSLGRVRPEVIVTAGPFDEADEVVYRQHERFHPALWVDPLFRAEYRRIEVRHQEQVVKTYEWIYARRNVELERLALPDGSCAALLAQ